MHWHMNVPPAYAQTCMCGRAVCGYVDSKQVHYGCPLHMPSIKTSYLSFGRGSGKSAHLHRDCPGRP